MSVSPSEAPTQESQKGDLKAKKPPSAYNNFVTKHLGDSSLLELSGEDRIKHIRNLWKEHKKLPKTQQDELNLKYSEEAVVVRSQKVVPKPANKPFVPSEYNKFVTEMNKDPRFDGFTGVERITMIGRLWKELKLESQQKLESESKSDSEPSSEIEETKGDSEAAKKASFPVFTGVKAGGINSDVGTVRPSSSVPPLPGLRYHVPSSGQQ